MNTSPAWINVTSPDAERSRTFYGALLGWDLHVDPGSGYAVAAPPPGGLAGGIDRARAGSFHVPGVVVYVTVDDLELAVARGLDGGGTVLHPTWELPGLGRMAVLGDPDGNRIGVWQQPSS